MCLLTCKEHYEHAAEALHLQFKSKVHMRNRVRREISNSSFARCLSMVWVHTNFNSQCSGQYTCTLFSVQEAWKWRTVLLKKAANENLVCSVRGILHYGMWLKSLQKNMNIGIDICEDVDQVPIHFEAVDWAKKNIVCTQLGHSLRTNLERALREVKNNLLSSIRDCAWETYMVLDTST